MALIRKDFSVGGKGLSPANIRPNESLLDILNGIADDLTNVQTDIAAIDAAAAAGGGLTLTLATATLNTSKEA